ncbi:MAG: DUF5916 domain-containing protein [Bacteroidota bacterium]
MEGIKMDDPPGEWRRARKDDHMNIRSILTFLLFPLFQVNVLLGQETFPPPEQPLEIPAAKVADDEIVLNGELSELAWREAQVISGFTQREPFQGRPASNDTEVRILFDSKFLYIGAVCKDSLSDRRRLRVRNLQRDFNGFGNDRFSVALDGLLDKRNAVGFEVTPYGSQRELQVIDGNEGDGNVDWDALWYVRTKVTDTAWITEMAIPWKTLRYKAGTDKMYIAFNRNIRRFNEITTWPAFPRAFSHFRMAYAALLTNLEPPPPSANIQINPYLLGDVGRTQEGDAPEEDKTNFEAGGEFKWAVTPNSILDVTVNTDFAQADVDQQVQNLTRFSILFPERRQFFLENASIFRVSDINNIQPFFSRQIGLDANGQPIPLDGGLRFTSRTSQQTSGVLAMRQQETATSPATYFAVGRYAQNLSGQNRIGGLVTHRIENAFTDENDQEIDARQNTTATVNAFFRPKQSLTLDAMVSYSTDDDQGNGVGASAWIYQQKNWGFMGFTGQYVSENYLPRMGFLRFNDYILAAPTIDLDIRPKWLPKFVRSYGPDLFTDFFWRASDGAFQQGIVNFSPFDLEWQTGGQLEFRTRQEWQELDASFTPLGIEIAPGSYQFGLYEFSLDSDFSRKLAGAITYGTGTFYDGNLENWDFDVRISPTPYIEFIGSYEINRFSNLGIAETDLTAQLLSTRARLALNPRVRLDGSYQWNSANEANIWNVRFAWEYRPLSFIFIVFNNNETEGFPSQPNLFSQQEVIGKITFLKQF